MDRGTIDLGMNIGPWDISEGKDKENVIIDRDVCVKEDDLAS